jgi:hypothetical protein
MKAIKSENISAFASESLSMVFCLGDLLRLRLRLRLVLRLGLDDLHGR